MKLLTGLFTILFFSSILLSGCVGDGNDLSGSSNYAMTAYARTIIVMQTSVAGITPTVDATRESAAQTAAAQTAAAPTARPAATETVWVGSSYLATNIGDMTIPDGSVLSPGERFKKTWQITNGGTGAWEPDFRVVFYGGDQMGAPDSIYISQYVAPGQTVTVSLDMTAPEIEGTYTGQYLLETNQGFSFGYGDSGIEPFTVVITVQGTSE